MSASGEVQYTFRALAPDVLQWGRDNIVALTIWRDGAQLVPSSATITVYDNTSSVAVATTAATVAADGTIRYTISSSVLPTSNPAILGQGWRLVWAVTISAGIVRTVDRMVDVARYPLFCPITDEDLKAYYPNLDAHKGASPASFQGFIDEALRTARAAFRAAGKFEYLFKNAEALREPLIHSALGMAFRSWSMGSGARANYQDLAVYHEAKAPASWASVALAVDWDGDGVVDDLTKRESVGAMITFGGAQRQQLGASRWNF